MRGRMPERPPGAGVNPHSGSVPAVPDTSTFRVACTTADGASEPPITRTSMSAIQTRHRARRRTRVAIGVTILVAAAVAVATYYVVTTGDATSAESMLLI